MTTSRRPGSRTRYGATGCSCWQSVDLTRSSVDQSIWTATLNIGAADPANLRFIVQAANGAALVGIDDNKGAYHSLASAAAGTPVPTTLDLTAPTSGAYNATVSVSAKLTRALPPSAAGPSSSASAPPSPRASRMRPGSPRRPCRSTRRRAPRRSWRHSTVSPRRPEQRRVGDHGQPLATNLTLTVGPGSALPGSAERRHRDPEDRDDADRRPDRSPSSRAAPAPAAGQGFVKSVTTDAAGVAALGATPTVPVGTYTIKAYFSGTIPLHPWGPPAASIELTTRSTSRASRRRGDEGHLSVHRVLLAGRQPADLEHRQGGQHHPGQVQPRRRPWHGHPRRRIAQARQDPCSTTAPTDALEEVTLEASGLKFTGGQYQWNWKTDKTDSGCWRFDLILVDGQTYSANFQFK